MTRLHRKNATLRKRTLANISLFDILCLGHGPDPRCDLSENDMRQLYVENREAFDVLRDAKSKVAPTIISATSPANVAGPGGKSTHLNRATKRFPRSNNSIDSACSPTGNCCCSSAMSTGRHRTSIRPTCLIVPGRGGGSSRRTFASGLSANRYNLSRWAESF